MKGIHKPLKMVFIQFKALKILVFLVIFINTKIFTMKMPSTIVTRGGQITLTKDVREKLGIREGDMIIVNVVGDRIVASKRDPSVFEKHHHFLPDNFPKILKEMRGGSFENRLKRLGIIQ